MWRLVSVLTTITSTMFEYKQLIWWYEICALKQFDAHVVQLRLNHSLVIHQNDRGKEGLNKIKAAKDGVFFNERFYLLFIIDFLLIISSYWPCTNKCTVSNHLIIRGTGNAELWLQTLHFACQTFCKALWMISVHPTMLIFKWPCSKRENYS